MFTSRVIALFFVLITISCNSDRSSSEDTEPQSTDTFNKDWPERLRVNSNAEEILKTWHEYVALEAGMEALYAVDNREEMLLALDELIKHQRALSESEFPPKFDIPQVKSRLKVFRTFILKTKGDLDYRKATDSSMVQMVNAYNAWKNQFNVVVNNTLDSTLIFTE